MTTQQRWILGIVTVLSGVMLGLAVILAAAIPSPQTTAQGAVLSTPSLSPATFTPAPTARPSPPLPPCAAALPGGEWFDEARVLDGSTIEVIANGKPVSVGYAALRIPEDGSLSGRAADAARQMIEGQPVYLTSAYAAQDSAGRALRYVFAGDRFVNLELVQAGLARADIYTDERACINLFQQGEQQARADHIGVWQATPAPTATFVPLVTLAPSLPPECDCSKRLQCWDFTSQKIAQVCYNACYDYNSRLDPDRDGLACEELP